MSKKSASQKKSAEIRDAVNFTPTKNERKNSLNSVPGNNNWPGLPVKGTEATGDSHER